jgi:hypothetical protein
MIIKEIREAKKQTIRWYGTQLCCKSLILAEIYGEVDGFGKFTGKYVGVSTQHLDNDMILFNPDTFENAKKITKEKTLDIIERANAKHV